MINSFSLPRQQGGAGQAAGHLESRRVRSARLFHARCRVKISLSILDSTNCPELRCARLPLNLRPRPGLVANCSAEGRGPLRREEGGGLDVKWLRSKNAAQCAPVWAIRQTHVLRIRSHPTNNVHWRGCSSVRVFLAVWRQQSGEIRRKEEFALSEEKFQTLNFVFVHPRL